MFQLNTISILILCAVSSGEPRVRVLSEYEYGNYKRQYDLQTENNWYALTKHEVFQGDYHGHALGNANDGAGECTDSFRQCFHLSDTECCEGLHCTTLSGWWKEDVPLCLPPICWSNPCQNEGACIQSEENTEDYRCDCKAGFEGENCENNIDECLPQPCKNGSNCVDGINDYTCECPAGYAGKDCEINIDECAPKPCQNGAVCIDLIADYACECPAGFEGKNCEVNIDECAVDEPLLAQPVASAVSVGCWIDKEGEERDMKFGPGRRKFFNVGDEQKCFDQCKSEGYQYAGLQWKGECWCDNTYGAYGEATEDSNTQCDCRMGADKHSFWGNCVYDMNA
jgi:hypothetical protein